MRTFIFGLAAAVVGIVATGSTASAQHHRTVISNSGNGANNTLVVRNGGPAPLYAPAGFGGGYGGFGPVVPGGFGGVNRTVISNSGNGIGNAIGVSNGGGYGGYPFGPGGYGVNVNVITNSGNGVGNTIQTNNSNSGGININVITNSGNGIGNTVGVRNR